MIFAPSQSLFTVPVSLPSGTLKLVGLETEVTLGHDRLLHIDGGIIILVVRMF